MKINHRKYKYLKRVFYKELDDKIQNKEVSCFIENIEIFFQDISNYTVTDYKESNDNDN